MTLARDQILWLIKYAFPFEFSFSLFLHVYKKWGSIFNFEVHDGCLFCPVKIFTVDLVIMLFCHWRDMISLKYL